MYYQMEFDRCLNGDGTFFYKEKMELLSGVSMYIRYSPVFKVEDGKEPYEQIIDIGGDCRSLNSLVKVSYDNKEKEFYFNLDKLVKDKISFQIVDYGKDVSQKVIGDLTPEQNELVSKRKFYGYSEAQIIDSEEFFFLKDNYGHMFENDNSLECCSYGWHEIKLFKEYDELELNCSYFVYHADRKEIVIATYTEDGVGYVWTIDDTKGIEHLDITNLTPVSTEQVEKDFNCFG